MIPLLINDIDDMIAWKFMSNGKCFVKSATWANNESGRPHPKAKLISI